MSFFSTSFVISMVFVCANVVASTGNPVAFYSDANCASNPIAILEVPQTAESCHEFAVNQNLQRLPIGSYGFSSSLAQGFNPGPTCISFNIPSSMHFEEACIQAFTNSPIQP